MVIRALLVALLNASIVFVLLVVLAAIVYIAAVDYIIVLLIVISFSCRKVWTKGPRGFCYSAS